MDEIEFRYYGSDEAGEEYPDEDWDVEIYINNKKLLTIITEIELPFAISEGHRGLAGGYKGLPPDVIFLPSRHLLDCPDPSLEEEGKVYVLGCTCGYAPCWPLLVKITLEEDKVIWSDFEQPFRKDTWRYDKFGPFIFDRLQYEVALMR